MNIYELLKKHEGVRNKMYEDSLGIKTIGIGHNLEDKPISDAAVKQIFEDDLQDVISDIKHNFSWFQQLDEVRQAVIIDMVFNLGIPRFKKFKNTINHIKAGTYSAAALEMLDSRWARQVGKRATELSRMMETGQWPQ